MSSTSRLPAAALLALLAGSAAGACSNDQSSPAAGDCTVLLRLGDQTYSSYATTRSRPAQPAAVAELSSCDDMGEDATGAYFPADPEHVQTWSFAGYTTADVVGVRVGKGWQVYVNDSMSADEASDLSLGLGLGAP